MFNTTLESDLVNFIGLRLQEGNNRHPRLAEDQGQAGNTIKDLAKILFSLGDTTYGDTEDRINCSIYDIMIEACSSYEENGYLKGLRDGIMLGKFI